MKYRLTRHSRLLAISCLLGIPIWEARAQTDTENFTPPGEVLVLDEVVVTGKAEELLGVAPSATKGQANNEELSKRPTLRRGELLEAVPGVVVAQHSGGGKANQYFLRGFNLDHGTDFNISVDSMPVNFRTHAHGQGYADLNFLVPEFVGGLDYFKGPFFPALGDLSTAGGAQYRMFQELPQGIASVTVGEYDYYRALIGDSFAAGDGVVTLGGEYAFENGPWLLDSNYERYNVFTRYHQGDDDDFLDLTAMFYQGEWKSTDQIPLRAVKSGRLDRFGFVDGSDGGDSSRYSLQLAKQWTDDGDGVTHIDIWGGYYDLDLFSNFTYYLNDPVRGDQFEQVESRYFAGAHIWHRQDYEVAGLPVRSTVGFQAQSDWIDDIGLHLTEKRRRHSTVREDDIYEGSFSLYLDNEARLTDWMRAGLGGRGDLFHFDVDSDSDSRANSGSEWAGIFSPKGHLVFGPWNETEIYLNGGLGFHSNDARGVTISRDPLTGEALDSVDPLVRTKGGELGVRSHLIPDVTASLGLWWLRSDSELVYVGDAGTSEAGPGSERYGVEATVYWRPRDWVAVDAEYAWSEAYFAGVPSNEREIPNAIEHSISAGLTVGGESGLYGAMRGRFFTGYPLEESGRLRADDSLILNARIGYRWNQKWDLAVDVLNLLDREDNDINYFYESRLSGEPAAGVADSHQHPVEPRQVRVSMTYRW